MSTPIPCSSGRYQPLTGASSCLPCSLGSAASQSGSVACTSCAPGSFANTTEAQRCLPCARGRFQGEFAQSTCIDCSPGKLRSDANDLKVARRPIQLEKRSQHVQLVRCGLHFCSSCSRHLLALSAQHCSGVARAEQLLTVHGNQIHSVHRFQGVLELPRSDVTSLLVLHLFASGVVNQYPQFPAEGQPTCSQCPTGAEWCVSPERSSDSISCTAPQI